jgi:hypothetical protein
MKKPMEKSRLEELLDEKENVDLTLSYSRLSDFDRNGPKALIERSIVDNQGVKMGSLIDDLLFSPSEFDDKYYILDITEPTATLGVLAKIILDNYVKVPDIEEIFNIIERNGLWKSIKKRELIQANFDTEDFWKYIKAKFEGNSRTLVTTDEVEKAKEVVEVLLNHKFSKELFSDQLEHVYQYKFQVTIKHFKFKGVIDIVTIDHKNKKIYFKDLKTGGAPSSEFMSSYIKWRYYLQEAVYMQASEQILAELELDGYEIQPFTFIYIGLKEKIPVTFVVTKRWHEAAKEGFTTMSGYNYKGLFELVEEVYFHWKNKVYDLSADVYTSNGVLDLDDSFINVKHVGNER